MCYFPCWTMRVTGSHSRYMWNETKEGDVEPAAKTPNFPVGFHAIVGDQAARSDGTIAFDRFHYSCGKSTFFQDFRDGTTHRGFPNVSCNAIEVRMLSPLPLRQGRGCALTGGHRLSVMP